MTNDEIERRANQIVTNWRQDSAVCESISLVNYVRAAIHLAVTAALEEAAKAPQRLIESMPEGTIFPVSKSLLKRVENEIRALKPVTPNEGR